MEQTATRSRTSASTSLGRASSFLVHQPHAQHSALKSSRGAAQTYVLRPSVSFSPQATAGPSPRVGEDVSHLPLDLLETAATRWASSAGRATRTAPRARSTVGPQSDVVDTGVFVCPDTVVAALYTNAGGRDDLVVTAECAGWLRVREQRTGGIRHQQQLRDGNEASCLAWAATAGGVLHGVAAAALQTVVAVGQLSGLVSFFAVVGESLVELAAATCVLHEAPVTACVPLPLPTTAAQASEDVRESGLLTVDAEGVVALWSLWVAERGPGGAVTLAVELLHCGYAAGMTVTPPVVVPAAPLFDAAAQPLCAVLTTHRFGDHPTAAEDASESESEEGDGGDSGALVFLAIFEQRGAAVTLPDLNGTTLAMPSQLSDTVATASTDSAAVASAASPPPSAVDGQHRWEVAMAYDLPAGLRSRPENQRPAIVSVCTVDGGRSGGGEGDVDAIQIWAGTADGRLLIWQAHTGHFVRYLRSASPSPVHGLTAVATRGAGGVGDALVWATQADGNVVAWSAITFAVVEVLPIGYPPPPPSESAADAAEAAVTVRDAVDLLRATRHPPPSPAASAGQPWASRRSGFTLFVQPMEVVCMQRAWSVATDGTVRTWLLPAAEAPASFFQHGEGVEESEGEARLDAHTVACFLQDKADEVVRLQQACQLERAAQQAQMSALRERNEVLAAALQQAIGRLERVGADGLVRSSSPTQQQDPQQDSLTAVGDKDSGAIASSKSKGTLGTPQQDRSSSERSAASTLSSPSTISPPPGQLIATTSQLDHSPPPAQPTSTQLHVQVLQQLLEELHGKLRDSWSHNDALREELLVYQLRTLEREEDMARRVRETVLRESATTAAATNAVDRHQRRESATSSSSSSSASSDVPSIPAPRARQHQCQQPQQRGSLRDTTTVTVEVQRGGTVLEGGGSHRSSPSRTVAAPPLAKLVTHTDNNDVSTTSAITTVAPAAHPAPIRAPSPPPSAASDVDDNDADFHSEKHAEEGRDGVMRGRSATTTTTTTAAASASRHANSAMTDRFLSAAAAALSHGRDGAGPLVGQHRGTPTPPRPIQAPIAAEEDVDVDVSTEDYYNNYSSEEEGQQPALVAAWSTSEADVSPISASSITAERGAAAAAAAAGRRMDLSGRSVDDADDSTRRPLHSSSLFSYPYLPNASSLQSTSYDQNTSSSRSVAPPTHPLRLYADARASARGGGAARPLPPPSASALSRGVGSPGPLPVSKDTPLRRTALPTAAASPPRSFRSPIIYHY